MESQSIIYGAIVFLALTFGDLGMTGIAALSGPLAALLLQIDSMRKRHGRTDKKSCSTFAFSSPEIEEARTPIPPATELAPGHDRCTCSFLLPDLYSLVSPENEC